MSHSPDSGEAGSDDLSDYNARWDAIYNLIDEGRSWSGRERNCAFINKGGAGFADVSAATGLDLIDDGRAVALVDWDFDGRLDFWVTSRTAPRLRLLHNRGGEAGNFVALRLRGVDCNRDAIGARLTLTAGDGTRLIRTLHAGDGYIAQSSKWLHFGLGDPPDVERIEVRWPGGATESFGAVEAGRFYRLVQGAGTPETWNPPRAGRVPLKESPLPLPDLPSTARTWLVGRVPFPATSFRSWEGATVPLDAYAGRPLLINLWSQSCGPCLAEFAEWDLHWNTIAKTGATVLALCADEDPRPDAVADLPFESGIATEELTFGLEALHHALLESRRPLPVPCSVLLDADGMVAAIYKGRLSPAQMVEDIGRLDAPAEAQRTAAVPFPGRWNTPVLQPAPRQVIGMLMIAGRREAARSYTLRCLRPDSKLDLPPKTRASMTVFLGDLHLDDGELVQAVALYRQLFELAPEDGELHREVGKRLVSRQRIGDAIAHLEKAVALIPDHADSRFNLVNLLLRSRRIDEATSHLRTLVQQVPDSAQVRFVLANALHGQGTTREALPHYRAAHQLSPGSAASNNLAWILATHRDADIRDGAEALELAKAICAKTDHRDANALSTLAAAHAELGNFEEAIRVAEQALELAQASPALASLAGQLRAGLELFREGKPIRH